MSKEEFLIFFKNEKVEKNIQGYTTVSSRSDIQHRDYSEFKVCVFTHIDFFHRCKYSVFTFHSGIPESNEGKDMQRNCKLWYSLANFCSLPCIPSGPFLTQYLGHTVLNMLGYAQTLHWESIPT